MVELKNIVKSFGAGKDGQEVHAVKDVSLTINDGEIFGIIGFSGAGKSTLVRCINLLERPNSGTVTIDGTELTALDAKGLRAERKKIGMIFQHFNLMPSRTVFGNVAFPLDKSGLTKAEIAEKVKKLLALVELSDKADAYPSELSGGQKQRVAIARALANEPKLLLSDEATSALDPQTTNAILKLLRKLNRELGITIVVITHEMEVIKQICSRVAVMEHGHVVEVGDTFDIFANPKHSLTRDFIKTTSNLYRIEDMLSEQLLGLDPEEDEVLVRFSYNAKTLTKPLIATASKQFDVELNILLASIDRVGDATIGGTVVNIRGESKRIDETLQFMKDNQVGVEVIRDARTHN